MSCNYGVAIVPEYENCQEGGASGGVQSVTGGTNITITGTATNPIINATGVGVNSILGGPGISVSGTATQPIITNQNPNKGVMTITAGTNITVNNADPFNPIINSTSVFVPTATTGLDMNTFNISNANNVEVDSTPAPPGDSLAGGLGFKRDVADSIIVELQKVVGLDGLQISTFNKSDYSLLSRGKIMTDLDTYVKSITAGSNVSITGTAPDFTISSTGNTWVGTATSNLNMDGNTIINAGLMEVATRTFADPLQMKFSYKDSNWGIAVTSTSIEVPNSIGASKLYKRYTNIGGGNTYTQILTTEDPYVATISPGANISITGTAPNFTIASSGGNNWVGTATSDLNMATNNIFGAKSVEVAASSFTSNRYVGGVGFKDATSNLRIQKETGGLDIYLNRYDNSGNFQLGNKILIENFNIITSINQGAGIVVNNTDPKQPVISSTCLQSIQGGNNIDIDFTDPLSPIISSNVQAVQIFPFGYWLITLYSESGGVEYSLNNDYDVTSSVYGTAYFLFPFFCKNNRKNIFISANYTSSHYIDAMLDNNNTKAYFGLETLIRSGGGGGGGGGGNQNMGFAGLSVMAKTFVDLSANKIPTFIFTENTGVTFTNAAGTQKVADIEVNENTTSRSEYYIQYKFVATGGFTFHFEMVDGTSSSVLGITPSIVVPAGAGDLDYSNFWYNLPLVIANTVSFTGGSNAKVNMVVETSSTPNTVGFIGVYIIGEQYITPPP